MPASDSIKSYGTASVPEQQPERPLKPYTKGTITAIGAIRVAAGAGLLIAPQFFGRLFHVPVPAQSVLLARAFGGRDLVLGELLLTADGNAKDRKEVKRALWAGIASDILDIGAAVIALSSGQLSRTGAGLFGGAATTFVLLGSVALRSLN